MADALNESDHLRGTLEHYRQQRQQKLRELRTIEMMIRQLENDLGEPPSVDYDADEPETPRVISSATITVRSTPIKPDEFYGMTQSEAAKAYLKRIGHAIPFDELVSALKRGGAKLGGADPKKTLYVSLARNPRKEFVWPSEDHISLSEFYENRK